MDYRSDTNVLNKRIIKIAIFILCLCLGGTMLFGKNYYVAKNGSDTNSGASITEPFLTIQKAAAIINAGDTCYIREGTYRETIIPAHSGTSDSPIRFRAYNNEKVIVNGADVVSGNWQSHSGNIYMTSINKSFIQLFVNGQMMNEARWPNAGIGVEALLSMPRANTGYGTNDTKLVDSNLPSGDWTGAYFHIAPGLAWNCFTREITSYKPGQELTYSPALPGPGGDSNLIPKDDNLYYLFGALAGLDTAGEWFLDTEAGIVYLWAPDNSSPDSLLVEVKQRDYAFILDNKTYVEVKDIDIFASAVSMEEAHYCTIDNIHALYVNHFREADGWSTAGGYTNFVSGSYNVWKNSEIQYSAGNGITVAGHHNSVSNCIIHDVNYMAIYAAAINSGDWWPADSNTYSYNTLYDTGRYIFMMYKTTNSQFVYNHMYNIKPLTKDTGFFVCWNTDGKGTEIAYNWIHDNPTPIGCGIYIDNNSSNYLIHHNVVWNCKDSGIRLNTPSNNNLVYNNTLLNNGDSINYWGSWDMGLGDPEDMTGCKLINNLCDGIIGYGKNPPPEVYHNGYYPVDTNFVPLSGSGAINAGQLIPGITDGFIGSAPDIGAYEYGARLWKPGAGNNMKLGDVNEDEKLDIVDALLIAQYSAGIKLVKFNVDMADVNSDGIVNILDALLVAKIAIGL
ncbi:MAG: right-handed parallel beta-helix repeat-containing protein [Spirochaetales bacterium]|nr:right-handed parallel beta-helix repeat-containing protein [Spirochaetales bacterium]